LVHAQKYLPVDLLLFENITVLLLHARIFEVLCYALRAPRHDLDFGVKIILLILRLLAINVREPVVTAVFAPRIVASQVFGDDAVSRRAHISDVLVDYAQRLVHDWTSDCIVISRKLPT
jgi:hypothetical protein